MLRTIIFLIYSLSLLSLSACAGNKKQYSCSWTPNMSGPHEATFCVNQGNTNGRSGSSMPVLEDLESKKIKQVNGQDLFLETSKVAAVRGKASSGNSRKCKHIWVSAKVEVKPETGEYWAPQWASEDRMMAKRTFPFYGVYIHELNDARCIKK